MEELIPTQESQIAKTKEIHEILEGYNLETLKIGMIASHSALDLADGAKDEGFSTVAVCQYGREKTYKRFNRIIKETIVLSKFEELLKEEVQKQLRDLNVIFVPNRSLTAYITPNKSIENEFLVPMFGNRHMLMIDDRGAQKSFFERAGIPHPKNYDSYEKIDRLCIVKALEPTKKIERAFFTCSSPDEFLKKWRTKFGDNPLSVLERQMKNGDVWIEEFVLGAQFNFNYFYSPIEERLDFLGIDRRIQTNIDGILRIPAKDQLEITVEPDYIEIGHESATIRESMLEKVYELGETFVEASKRMYVNGIIGPFALQGAVTRDQEIVVYDLSPRMPGSPVLYSSPYSKYYFGKNITSGRRVAMELRQASDNMEQLKKVIT